MNTHGDTEPGDAGGGAGQAANRLVRSLARRPQPEPQPRPEPQPQPQAQPQPEPQPQPQLQPEPQPRPQPEPQHHRPPQDADTPPHAPHAPAATPSKSEQTRALILDTALRLFRERGYDRTTMRAIAEEAGVSVGNAYYYFASKEHLVQGFYDLIAREHRQQLPAALTGKRDLGDRLRTTLEVWMAIAAPYHEFAAQLFKNAADPASPLSPFSAESAPARDAMIDLYRDVLTGSDAKLDSDLAAMMPELLWLYHMGIVLYWVYDRSPRTARTARLVIRATAVVARLIALSRFKILRPLVREAKDLLTEFILIHDPNPSND